MSQALVAAAMEIRGIEGVVLNLHKWPEELTSKSLDYSVLSSKWIAIRVPKALRSTGFADSVEAFSEGAVVLSFQW